MSTEDMKCNDSDAVQAIQSVAAELICPITMELPVDPVIAADGKIYERSAIEKWIRRHRDNLRSPSTNEKMLSYIIPAVQVKNAIEALVKSQVILGDKAESWRDRIEEEEELTSMIKRAKSGDTDVMFQLGRWYEEEDGHNVAEAHMWYKRASDQGHVGALARVGRDLVFGFGVEKDIAQGLSVMLLAAQRGSTLAAYFLGVWHKDGKYGLVRSSSRALRWLQSALQDGGCGVEGGELDYLCRCNAKLRLDELKEACRKNSAGKRLRTALRRTGARSKQQIIS